MSEASAGRPLTVRPLRDDEHPEVGRITVEAYASEGLVPADAPYAAELADVASRDREAQVLVAELDGRVVGTVTWCPVGSPYREIATDDGQAEFRMLAVDPQARRCGAARALVEACLVRARAGAAREVVLSCLPQSVPAHRLYASLGFVRAPELDWSPSPAVLLWGFRLPLHPADP